VGVGWGRGEREGKRGKVGVCFCVDLHACFFFILFLHTPSAFSFRKTKKNFVSEQKRKEKGKEKAGVRLGKDRQGQQQQQQEGKGGRGGGWAKREGTHT
jgi:hypothetical protein